MREMELSPRESELSDRYLELLKQCLTFSLWGAADGSSFSGGGGRGWRGWLYGLLARRGMRLVRTRPDEDARRTRELGGDCPAMADTMIGVQRLNNLHQCVETVLRDEVPGDLIETGVWRGGATILMRAVLKAWGVTDRRVFVADSFEGLPDPQSRQEQERHLKAPSLAVSIDDVRANFRRYGLLDDQVVFLKGWFKDTLPAAPIGRLAVARLDGDMYDSTWDAIINLYPKLSPGGFLIVDDYHAVPGCRQAIHDYRDRHGITEPIEEIDGTGVFWRRTQERGPGHGNHQPASQASSASAAR